MQTSTTPEPMGPERCGHAVADLGRACGTEDLLINAWIDAQIRPLVAAENR